MCEGVCACVSESVCACVYNIYHETQNSLVKDFMAGPFIAANQLFYPCGTNLTTVFRQYASLSMVNNLP